MKLAFAILLPLVKLAGACPFVVKVVGGNAYDDDHTGVYTLLNRTYGNHPVYKAVHATNVGGVGRYIYFRVDQSLFRGGHWLVGKGSFNGDDMRGSGQPNLKSMLTVATCPHEPMVWKVWNSVDWILEPFLNVTEQDLSVSLGHRDSFFRPFLINGTSNCQTYKPIEQAVDGSWETYWGCYGGDRTYPRSYYADLGAVYMSISGVEISWGPFAADSFKVSVSMDNKTFTEVITIKDQNGVAYSNCDQALLIPSVAAQYIRIDMIKENAESIYNTFGAVTVRELSFSVADGRWQIRATTNGLQLMGDLQQGLEGTTSTTTRVYFWLDNGQWNVGNSPPEPMKTSRWRHHQGLEWATTMTTTMDNRTDTIAYKTTKWLRASPGSQELEQACTSGHRCVDESTLLGLGCPAGYFCLSQYGCCEACPSGHSWQNGPIIKNCDAGYRQSDEDNFGYYGCCKRARGEITQNGRREELTTTDLPPGPGGVRPDAALKHLKSQVAGELKDFGKALQSTFIKTIMKPLQSPANKEATATSTASLSKPSLVKASAETAAPGVSSLQSEKLLFWVNPWFITCCALFLAALCAGIVLGIACHARLRKLDRTPLLEGAARELDSIHAAQPAAEFHQMA